MKTLRERRSMVISAAALALLAMSCGDRASTTTPPPTGTSASPPPTTTTATPSLPSMPSAPSVTRPRAAVSIPDCLPSWRALAVHPRVAVVRVLSPFAPTQPFGASHGERIPAYSFGVSVTRWFGDPPTIGGTPRSLDRRGDLPLDRFTRGIARIVTFEAVERQVRDAVGGELVVLLDWTEGMTRGVCLIDGCIVPSSPAMHAAIAEELADQAADLAHEPTPVPAVATAINAMTRPGSALDSLRTLLAIGPAAFPDLARRLGDSRLTHLGVVDFVGPPQSRRHSVATIGAAALALLEEQTGLQCPCGPDVRTTPDGDRYACGRCWRIVAAKAQRHASGQPVSRCAAAR